MIKFIKNLWGAKPGPARSRPRIVIGADRATDIFVIGDIHGHLDLLLAAEDHIYRRMHGRSKPALVVCLGDFVDRGPNSSGVLDHLIEKMRRPFYRLSICGNHDDAFLNFIREEKFSPHWLQFGGEKTLLSYGVDTPHMLNLDPRGLMLKQLVHNHVPKPHVDFLERLPVALSIGKYLFVHAGIKPGVPLDQQSDLDLMWIREPFLTQGPKLDMTVIHGHTTSGSIQFGPNRIGIDTGAYQTGKLSVLHIGPHGIEGI